MWQPKILFCIIKISWWEDKEFCINQWWFICESQLEIFGGEYFVILEGDEQLGQWLCSAIKYNDECLMVNGGFIIE